MGFRRILPRHGASGILALLAMWAVMTTLVWGAGQTQGGRTTAPGVAGTNSLSQSTQQSAGRLAAPTPSLSDVAKARQLTSYRKLPLSFVPNRGQTDPQVRFTSQGRGYTLFLTSSEAVLTLSKSSRSAKPLLPGERAKADAVSSGVLRMKLAGARSSVEPTGAELLPGTSNYYIGNDSRKWLTNVPNYGRVVYNDVYPGVNLVYYGSNQQQLEYDFVVKAGADPKAIGIAFDLAGMSGKGKKASLSVDGKGDLLIHGADGDTIFHKPLVYQPTFGPDGQGRRSLDGKYVLAQNNEVHFAVADYDKRFPLVIDPTLSYSTYLGGNAKDEALGIGVDGSNNVYVTGDTTSTNFPGVGDPLVSITYAFVTELNTSGGLVYTSILAGTGDDAGGTAIFVDASGNAYITGVTISSTFPVTGGAFQTTFQGSQDAFVAKLGEGGTVTYASYLGGSIFAAGESALTAGAAIFVDSLGDAYVAGQTNVSNLPTSPVAVYQSAYGGGSEDGFVAEFNPTGTGVLYLTYFGGSNTDAINGIFVNGSGDAFITGSTSSTNFPASAGAYQASLQGNEDAFVAELGSGGLSLVFSTFLGGSTGAPGLLQTSASAITVDSYGKIYVTGYTNTTNYPTAAVTVDIHEPVTPFQTALPGGSSPFVTKLNSTGTALVYSTYMGGSAADYAQAIIVDASGNAYVTGYTISADFPTVMPLYSSCAGICEDESDIFLARMNPEGTNLVFSTFLGGTGGDYGQGLAADTLGNTWLTGLTYSSNFPTVNPYQATHGADEGLADAIVASIQGINPIRSNPGFVTNTFGANDDGSVGPINLGFTVNFFGTNFSEIYVNNNGNMTFGNSLGEFTPTGLTQSDLPSIIAPFWADVDTRGAGSGLVHYGPDTVNGMNAFGVNWINVGYYGAQTDKLNSFQAVLIDRSDVAAGDFDIEFNYGKIQWETGQASSGVDGIGGEPVHVGYSNGTGQAGTNFELPGSGTSGYFLDSNPATGLIYGSSGSVLGRLVFQVRGGQVQQSGSDVGITLTHLPDPVNVGNPLTINMTVTDNGPSDATGVTVMDALPSNATFVSALPSQGSCGGTTVVTCNLGSITNGHSATIALVVTVTSGTSLSDTATVTATSTDPNAANNSSTTTATVNSGNTPIVSLSPVNLTYQHNLNLTCPFKPLMLSNTGGSTLQISSVTATGPFAISANACGATLPAGQSCEIDVSFTAEAPIGVYSGSVVVVDNAPDTPQAVPLSGQVFPPCLMQSDTPSQEIVRSTPSVTFNIRDTQPSCHTTTTTMSCLNNQQASCAFSPAVISPGGSTVLTVQNLNALTTDNFTFTAQGTDKTNTTGVSLSVIMSDFTYTPAASTASVTAGQTATYALTLTPINGLSGTVNLACQGAPSGSTCTVSPMTVTLAQNAPAQVTVSVTTAGRSMGAPQGGAPLQGPGASMRLWLELASLLALFGLTGWGAVGTRRARAQQTSLAFRRLRMSGLVLAGLAMMIMVWAACGGGGGGMTSVASNPGTPSGTYALTVTGTFNNSSGQATGLTRTQNLSLQVK